jgi:DNA-binding transcriptional ArsR family regulator
MNQDALDPLIHVPTRLKIVATLAALPDGDTLSFTRLQDMIGLTPGNLIIHLRKLEEADYISSEKSRNGTVSVTTVALTGHGREALGAYTQALRDLLGGLLSEAQTAMSTGALDPLIHNPQRLRIIATLAALRYGDGLPVTRLQDMTGLPPGSPVTGLRELGQAGLDELSARLDATLTATTHGELSQAAQDLPDLTPFPAQASLPRRTRVFARPARSRRVRRPPATTAGRASW